MKSMKGFTLAELLIVVWFVLVVCIIGGLGWVVAHFISKFW